MKRIFFIAILLVVKTLGWAQINKLDSLAQIIAKKGASFNPNSIPNRDSLIKHFPSIKSDSKRIEALADIFHNYGELEPSKTLNYEHKILDLVKRNNDKISQAVILCDLAYTISKNGDLAEGMKLNLEALKLAQNSGNNMVIGLCYDILGILSENINLKKIYHMKAVYYTHIGGHSLVECFAYGHLVQVLLAEHKPDSARFFLAKGLELASNKNSHFVFPYLLSEISYFQNSLVNKIKYQKLALKLPFTKFTISNPVNINYRIAEIYHDYQITDSSLFYAKKAFQISFAGYLGYRIKPAKLLMTIYKSKNVDSALKYTQIYYTTKDSVYNLNKSENAQAMAFSQQLHDQQSEVQKLAQKATVRMYFMTLVIVFFVIIAFIFWRSNRISKIAKIKVEQALMQLKATQTQLIQSEKMASLGELTAGIAHEIQNPLNFVNNFSEVNKELLFELKDELAAKNFDEATAIADDVIQNEEKINHHGKRADAIVKGMLEHSRVGSGIKEPTDINKLADEYLRLSYHGLRAKDKAFNAEMVTNFDEKLPLINVIPQDIGRVLLNLFNNAFYAVNQKQKTAGADYKPEVTITTYLENNQVIIKVKDNGIGIPDAIKDKIMQPFFTTKPTGEGTGLGLSLTYDMVAKGHGGKIYVETKENEYSVFSISIPF